MSVGLVLFIFVMGAVAGSTLTVLYDVLLKQHKDSLD